MMRSAKQHVAEQEASVGHPTRRRWLTLDAQASRALLRVEAKLFLRDGPAAVFALLVPGMVLAAAGYAIPGMRETISDPSAGWDGLTLIQAYTPSVLTMALATPALSALPVALATYRERGVLRRLSTTPVPPAALLRAQVIVNLGAFGVASLVALVISWTLFDAPMPGQPLLTALTLALGAVSVFGLGLLVAARARTASAATSTGMLLYFPLLFLAGMWTPGPLLPDIVATAATYTPSGALSQALTTAWFGGDFPAPQLLVMCAWIAVMYPLSARFFRWS